MKLMMDLIVTPSFYAGSHDSNESHMNKKTTPYPEL
ncbi:hypothetical protein SAMN05421784_11720 [Xenorhabdus koppenhoeferi]|uniref:Uncharacterized protein n=1 Tax=Xenorhabdus koppenhoeferi TaxID=351659 RepID=A0A1I7HZ00_9GAMM|nr:hypothetical protein SAMN05421784_11720 [Xenorhabdus koppenhoeferi]